MILQKDTLNLRTPELQDLELLLAWENEKTNWKVSGTRKPYTKLEMLQFIENCKQSISEMEQQRFMINVEGRCVGTLDFFEYDEIHQRVGVGILIASARERKKGYAYMALQLALNYAFKELKMDQVFCNILTENKGSLNLFHKLGFKDVGVKRKWVFYNGSFYDEMSLQLLQEDWNEA